MKMQTYALSLFLIMAVFASAVPAFAQSDLVDLYAFLDFLPLEDGFVPEDVTLSSDGMRMFILDSAGHRVEEYRLNTAYDITGATSMGFQGLPSVIINRVAEDSVQDIEFSTNGRILFFLGAQHHQIFAFSLPSPYDIAGAAFRDNLQLRTFHPDPPLEPITTISPTGMSFAADGRTIFVVGTNQNERLNYLEIPLNRSFDLDRASISAEGNLAFSNMEDIELLDSNDEIFIINNNMIHGFDDSPNVNGTASFVSLDVRLQDPMPTGIDISPNASKMFITGAQTNRVYEYELDRPPTFTVTSTMSVNEGDNLEDFGRFFEATDPDGDPVTYGFINSRDGITITRDGLLRGTLPYDVVGCTADKVIPITVFASDDGFDVDPTDSASLVYGLRITSSPNPENSPTRADRSFLVVPANQRTIDMSLYDTDDDDDILTYHDAAVSPDGIISTASIDEDGILSITQNPGGISSELTYGVCNGEDYIPLSITLRAADATPRPPEFIIIPDEVTIPEGTVISPELINFIASDPNGDGALSYRLVDAPDWLEIEPSVDLPSVGRLLGTVPHDVVGCDGGSTSLTFDVQISDDGFVDPANTISVQYTMTVTSLNIQGNSDPILSTILVYKGTSTIDLNAFSFDGDGDSLTYSNPNTVFLVVNSLSPDGMMNVTVPHDPGSSGTMSITMCDGSRFVTRTATVSVPVYEFVDSRDTPSAVEEISGMYFSNDGRQLFQVASGLDNAYEIIFEQSFDISAPSTENEVFLESVPDAIDVVFDGDGNNMFVVESDGGIFQYALSEPFFLDDGTGTPVITDISSHFAVNPDLGVLNIQGVDFSANGDKMYAVTTTGTAFNDIVYEFTLDRNFDIASISSTQFRNISDRVGVARDIRISDDDAKMFIVNSAGDLRRPSHIVEYTFGSSLDLSTAEFSGIYNIANQREEPVSVEFSANGYKMFVAENDNDNINEYNLGLPFTMLSDTDVILPVDEEFAGIFRKSSLPITVNFNRPMTDFTADDIVLTGSVNSNDPQISNFTGSSASYSFNVERGASDGDVTILIGRGVATDEFGHPNEISRPSSVFIDVPPVPFINSTVPSPTNLLTISYTVEFSDPVGGFNATGIEVTGSAGGIVENFVKIDDESYTFDVSHNSVEGVVSVFIPAGVADELTVRPSKNLASNRLTHTIDRIAPMPTLTSTSQEDTNSRTIPFTVDFGEPVTGFDYTDIAVTGLAEVDEDSFEAESDSVYNFDVVATADGRVSVQIPEDVAQDAAENENVASGEVARTVDTVRPTVGISTITISPTNLASISYTVTFEEEVNDFDAGDIDASIPGSTPTVIGPTLTSGNTQTYVVDHNADEGILTVFIPENVATDDAGNNNIASNTLVHTIDRIAPTVDGASVSDTDTIILDISESLSESGGVAPDFAISGVATNPSVASIDITGSTITLNLDDSIADEDSPLVSYTGTAGSIEDLAENPLAAFTERSVTNNLDTTAPTPVLSNEIDSPTNLATIPYTVDFGESVSGFDGNDIRVLIDGASLTASEPVPGIGDAYTFGVTHGVLEGELMVSILENSVMDGAGNTNDASDTLVHTVDRIAPTVTDATVSDTDTIVLTISELLSESGGAASDFTISGVATNPSVASIDITGSTITLNLDNSITDADNPTVSYTETGGIEDLAENRLANFAGQTVENDLDTTLPVPTLTITSEPGSTHTNSPTVSYMVKFDMDVDGFIEGDIMVEGSANNGNPEVSNFIIVDDATYTFEVERDNSDGNVIVFIPENRATDRSGNQNVASDRLEIIFDTILPLATLASTESGDTRLRTIPVNVTFSERVDDFDADDIVIEGSATVNAPVTNDNILYMFDIVATADGDVTVSIREDAVRDVAGNRNVESETVTFMVDTKRPIAGLSSIVVSPTNLEVIPYTVDFGEQVNDFVAIDFGIPTSSSGLLATNPVSADNIIYTFDISHGADEGIISVLIPENATTDNAGNNNTASESLAITIDRIAPTVDGASVSDTDTIILDISESLSESGGAASDFAISGVATNPSVASIAVSGSTITLNLDDSITDEDSPLVSYTGTAGSIEDLAENTLAAFTNRAVENEIDTTRPAPTLTITSESGAVTHTNSSTVTYMVTFDMDVTRFNATGIEVSGSANNGNPEVSVFAGSGDTYTFDVERGDSDGNVIVFIPADRAIDGSGNQNVASNRLEIIFDTISPTLTLASTESGDTRLRTIPVNVTFSERVDDFDADDIIIEGSATADTPTTNDNILYMFDIVAIADGDVTVSIREDAVRDATGNRNAASGTIAFAVDTVRPSVEIASSTVTDLPTNLEFIPYTVTFRESINGFTATDITASIVGSTPTVTGPSLTIGNTQTYVIAHGVNEGVLMVSIPENVATDNAGNNNTASNILVHTIDRIAPTITTATVFDTDTIRLVMSEAVFDNSTTLSDFAISGVSSGPSVVSIAVSGSTVDLNLDDSITDTDAPRIAYSRTDGSIDDLAENPLADFASQIVTNNIDTTAPMPTLATVSPPLTNSQTIAFTVDFGEIVTGFDDTSSIRVTGTSGAAASAPTGSGRNYDFTVNRGSLDGTVIVTILAGAARDGDENLSVASETITITIDTTPPTVTGASVSDTDTIILDISEPVSDDSATVSDFVISDVASNPAVSSITVSGSMVTLDLNRLITDADVPLVSYIRTAGSINDTAKNPLADFANESVTNDIDTTRPTVTAFTTTSSNPTNSQTITYAVQFSESVTGFDATGIGVAGTSGGIASEPVGSDRDYDFTVERGISDGTVIVTILEGAARDADMNLSFASTPLEITVDATPPTVTGAEVVNPNIIRLDISEPISNVGAVASDFAISGAASTPVVSSIAVSGSSIELSLAPPLTDADNPIVAYTRTAGGIEDPATNRLVDFANQIATNNIDTTAPVPTISTTADFLTNLAVIPYMVEFTEEVSGFDRNGIDASIDGVPLTASEPIQGEGDTYTFGVTHGVNEGELRVSIRAGAATDMDSNTSTASNTLVHTIDRIAPTVDGASVSDTDTIILEISEPVSGGAASDFTISGVATNPSVASIDITGSTITLNLDNSITDADNPTVSYTETGGIEDLAENRLANFAGQTVENDLDTTRPVPTLTITSEPGSTHTNSPTVSYVVTFDMDVTGFDEDDIEVEGSANNGNPEASNFITVDGDEYTFDVERDNSDGNVMVSIPENRATDLAGNQNIASNMLEITFDTISPTATLASTESGDTRLRTIPVNVTFSERVDDFDADDIVIVGSATADTPTTNDNILYMFDIVAIADGDVTVSIRENAVLDMADNGNAESETIAFMVDTVRPIIDISTTADLLTNLESISYTVTFRESINGFTATDITASIVGSTPTVTGPVLTIGNTQTYIIAHGVNEGVLTVSIPENVATDDAGNNNTASNTLVHTIDRIAPTITAASVLDTDTIRLVMSETVSDNSTTISDFDISGVVSSPAVASIAVSGSTITLNLDDSITDTDAPRIAYSRTDGSIDDLAENPLADFANQIVANNIDTTAPMPTLATVSPPLTNSQTIAFTVDFGEIVTGFDDTSSIRVTGTSGAAASAPTGSGRNYDFTVNRGSLDGTVIVTILAGAARDGDENLSVASGEITITIDTTPPTVTGASVSDTDTIVLTISELLSESGGVASDFAISGVATNPSVSSIDIAGSTITLDLNGLITDADNPVISYTGTAGIEDLAENPLADFANESVTNDIDTTRPTVTAFTTTSSNPTNSQTITYAVQFSESVTGFDATGIGVAGTSGGIASEPVGSDRDYDFTVERGISDGTVIVTILEGAARDADMNLSFASTPLEITVDATPPTVTGAEVVNPNIIRLDISEPISNVGAVASDFAISGAASTPVVSSIAVSGSSIELSLAPPLTDADNPIVAYTRTAGGIEDPATNRLVDFANQIATNNIDTTAPVPTISTTADFLTNLAVIPYMVEFTEEVSGFDRNGIDASIDGVPLTASEPIQGEGDTYTFGVTHGVNEGELRVSIRAGAATDMDSNTSTASNTLTLTVDRIAPTITAASVLDTDTIRLVMSETVSDNSTTISDFDISGVVSSPAVASIAVSGSTITLNLDDSITDTDAPRIAYSRTDGSIDDLAENPLADFANQIVANEIDTTAPMPTLATVSPPLTNSQTIAFTVDFGEIVTGFDDTSSIRVTGTSGAAASAPTGSGRNYDFTVNRGSSDGTVIVTVLAGAARDGDENLSVASGEITITIDTTPPTVTDASVSDTDTIILDISEPVSDDSATASDFVISDVATNPAVSSITVSGSTVTLDLNRLITDADVPLVSYTRTAGSINDTAKNPLADFANEPVANDIDTTRPMVTAFTTTSSNPTNSQTIMYAVQFSEPVTRFNATGIDVSGTSGGTAAEPTGAGINYEFVVTRGASDGTVIVTILEGAARDVDMNLSFASTPLEITVDATPPTVTAASVVNPNIIRLDISEPVSDINAVASDFAISGAASSPVVSSIVVSGSSIELSLSQPLTDVDNPTVAYTRTAGGIEDAAENRLADFANQMATNNIDTTAPVPTLSTDIDSPTNLAVMPYMVVFTEDVSGFDRNDIDASIGGAPLTASNPVTNDNITYTFTITHGVSEGELRVSIRAGAATDMDSNTSTASNTISRMIDRIAPTVTSATASDTDTIILEISEPVSGGAASDFTISGVATNPSVSSIGITGSTITLELNGLITDADNPAVSYTGTVDIEDAAENRLADFANQLVENDLDTTGPVPTLTITSEPGSTHTNSPAVSYRVEFDMDVVGFIEGDIMVEGSANNGNPETSNFVTVDDATYTFDVERNNSDGNVIVSIPENRATDLAGNQNIASNMLEITFDTISPTLMFASTESGDTKLRTIPFTVRFDEVVSGFDRNDIIIEGSATARQPTTSDEIFYEFDVVATSDGQVTVSIRENAVLDMADNGNTASGMITLTVDTGRVRADLSTDIDSPTNLATIPYTVDFGEPVTGFTAADIDASVDGTPVTASVPVAGAGNTYTFGVTHNVLEGEVTVSIMAGAVMDGAENTNDASNSITLTVERIAPTVTAASVSDTNTIVLNISEFVSGGVASDFTVTGVASIPAVSSIDIADNMIMLTLDGFITDADNPVISYTETDGIEDLAENRLAAFANQMVANNLDTTGPVPAITSSTNSPTNSLEIQYTVDFVERVDGFDEGDISASIGDVQLRASRPTSDDGIIYTFMITHGAAAGTIMVSIPANSVTDGDGNVNAASNVITHVVDRVGPVPSVSTETSSPTNLATVQYNVTFNMPVTGFVEGDIVVSGSASIIQGSFVMINSTDYTFEVARSSDGVARASVPAGSAIDGADNGNAASNVATIVFDTTAPVARSGTLLNNGNIRLAMSERVFDNGTAASDFAVSGAASSPQVTSISVFRSAIELGLDGPITDDDAPTVSYNRTSGNVHDAATNSLGNFTGIEIGIEDDGVDNTKWRTKATFGISYVHGEKLVDCGYSMDNTCRDVLDYHVDYQRQSITTNSTHDYTLKTYAQNGLRSLGIAFGVPSIGSPLSSAEAQIRVDLARDYDVQSTYVVENVEYINDNHVIGQNATFEISQVQCLPTDERHDCVLLSINDVLFREQLYYEPFVISAMDSNRYATVHFMNDGILVYGDSMNEAPTHDLTTKLAHQRDLAQLTLTRTDKLSDVWTDQHGHTWTKNSFGTWSYVEIPKITVRPSCTDIDDRVCEAFGKKLDWHTANMEDMRDSLYGDIYTTPAFDSLTEVITLHDVDGDSRAAFLAESAYYLLE